MGNKQVVAVARDPVATKKLLGYLPGVDPDPDFQIDPKSVALVKRREAIQLQLQEQAKTPFEKIFEDTGKIGKEFASFVSAQINKVTDVPGQALDTTNILVIGAVILGAIVVMNVDVAAFA